MSAFFFFVSALWSPVYAANITLSPSSVTTQKNKTFTLDVILTNNTDTINAVSGTLSFQPKKLQVVSLSKSGSLLSMWAEEPSFSNTEGSVSFEGISLNPGFSASSGKVLTVTFRSLEPGVEVTRLISGSVLVNDGNATDVLETLGGATITTQEAVIKVVEQVVPKAASEPAVSKTPEEKSSLIITSSSHPDSNTWYTSKDAAFAWVLPKDASAMRTLYDEQPSSTPTKVFDPPISNRSFSVDGEGVMYLHVQARTESGWGAVSHYSFRIDSTKPEKPKIIFTNGSTTANPSPSVLITADDAISGLEYLTISIDETKPVTFPIDSSNLYKVPRQDFGKHTMVVTVYDKAGNSASSTVEYTIQALKKPIIREYTKNLAGSDDVTVTGEAEPGSTVEVKLTRESSLGLFSFFSPQGRMPSAEADEGTVVSDSQLVTADKNGIFKLTWSKDLEPGVYKMEVRILDQSGGVSEYTPTKTVVVNAATPLRYGVFIMNWLSVLLTGVIGGIAVAGTLWYSLVQFRRFRRKTRRTMLEAENTLKVNVSALKRDVEEFHKILLKAKKKRELTKEEESMLRKFKKRIDITEQEIEKKLEDIG